MKYGMTVGSIAAALLLCAGTAAAAPRGWSTDYQGTRAAARAAGKHVLLAIVDSANCYASRAFKRNVVDNEGWADWREGNKDRLLLVWWDRAEIAASRWATTAFLFASGGETPSVSTPLVAVFSPDGMLAVPVLDNTDGVLMDFDEFTAAVDERLEGWEDIPSGALVWPAVTSASGQRARWSLDYQGSRDKGFAKRWPVLVAIVDSGGASATTEAWVRGVLMTEEWQDWLDERNILLVWWDRAKISRTKWDDVAFRFAAGGESITLPQMVLFDTNGLKTDQFQPVNNLSRADDFISRLEENDAIDWDELGFGPGTVGFTVPRQTVSAATNVVTVTVARSGGASEGAQTFRVYTASGGETNAAVTNVHYRVVNTQLVWAAGESGIKTVDVELLGVAEDFDVTVTQRVFHVNLERVASSTAKLGTTNHTVVISYSPGTIGFTANALTVYAGETNVEVTVRRSGGALGRQSAMLKTFARAEEVTDYFEAVETNLVWTSGQEGEKRVLIPLKGDALDWRAALTGQVFDASLSLATNFPAATPGITNLSVTLRSSVERTGDWAYDRTNQWKVAANTAGRASALTWQAPQGGWIDFAWSKGSGDGALTVVLPSTTNTSGVVTNSVASEVTNRVAIADGERVVWTVTNCTATVKLLTWTPAEVQMIAPTNREVVAATNVPLSWAVQPGVTSLLYYAHMPHPQQYLYGAYGDVTNQVSFTNSASDTVTWYVEMEIRGDLGTVARVQGPTWLFSFQTQTNTPSPPTPTFNTMVSRGIVLHQYVPVSVPAEAGLQTANAKRRYTAKGLPNGLKIDASTGVISGTPKRAGLSLATVKATGDGVAAVIELAIEVLVFPAFALGEFQGMALDDAGRVRGALALKVSASGAVSGKIESGGQIRSLRGVWVDGSAQSRAVRLSAGRAAAMELSFTPEGVEGVTAEGWRVFARPLLSQEAAQQFAGSYTVVLSADTADIPGAPSGYGYLTYTVTPRTRSVKYGGLLADGTSVSGSAKMVAGDEEGVALFPLYKGLYTRRGEVSGVAVSMTDGGVVVRQGGWVNPGGGTSRQGSRVPFDVALDGDGARYAQPADWSALDGAVLTAGGQPFAVLSAARGKPVSQTAGVTFSLTQKSGVFTGRFKDEDNITRSFKGVYMPALLYGAGFYLCPDGEAEAGTCSLPIELESE